MAQHLKGVTVNPDHCGGAPCSRRMSIRVIDILDLLAPGQRPEEILKGFPDREREDIKAALRYASRPLDHATLAA
jgi:uncharacterized protein (DUF433 family)